MAEFLPAGTEIPASDRPYTKFSEGETRVRILDSAIAGYELWVDGKPVRRGSRDEFTSEQLEGADINKFTGEKKTPAYFWAFPVWNYATERVEILEVTQVTIMRAMEDYLNDEDYGSEPWKYDFIIVRDESGDKVEYRVKAKPPTEMDEKISETYNGMQVRLEALFEGEDPFAEVVEEKTDSSGSDGNL